MYSKDISAIREICRFKIKGFIPAEFGSELSVFRDGELVTGRQREVMMITEKQPEFSAGWRRAGGVQSSGYSDRLRRMRESRVSGPVFVRDES
jgi:hypothetical protein